MLDISGEITFRFFFWISILLRGVASENGNRATFGWGTKMPCLAPVDWTSPESKCIFLSYMGQLSCIIGIGSGH
jgi:hypothetical protein